MQGVLKPGVTRGSSKRGAALAETILLLHLVVVPTILLVMLFGDNVRALFAAADNSLAGVDSLPATRQAQSMNQKDRMLAALQKALRNPNARVHGDWQPVANFDPRAIRGMQDWEPVKVAHSHDRHEDPPSKWAVASAGLFQGVLNVVKLAVRSPETFDRFLFWANEKGKRFLPEFMTRPIMPDPFFYLAHGEQVGSGGFPGLSDVANGIGDWQQDMTTEYRSFHALAQHAERFNEITRQMVSEKSLKPLNEMDADMVVGAVFTAAPSLAVTLFSGGWATAGAASKVEAAHKFTRAAVTAGALLEGLAYSDGVAQFEQHMRQATGDPDFRIPDDEYVAATATVAVVAGVAEGLGGRVVYRSLPGASQTVGALMKRMLQRVASTGNAMVVEGGTEGFQEWIANASRKLTYDPDTDLGDGVLQSAIGGLGSSGAVAVTGATLATFNDMISFGANLSLDRFVTNVDGHDHLVVPTSQESFYDSIGKLNSRLLNRVLRRNLFYRRTLKEMKGEPFKHNRIADRILREFDEHFQGAPQKYKGLLFDFGILDNWKLFTGFLKKHPRLYESKAPHEIRQMFAEELGTTTVYRGVALPKAEFATAEDAIAHLMAHGNWGKDLRNVVSDFKIDRIKYQMGGGKKSGYRELTVGRYAFDSCLDTMVSVSEFPQVARNITYHLSGDPAESHMILMKIEIPKIDLIQQRFGGLFWQYEDGMNPFRDWGWPRTTYQLEGKIFSSGTFRSSLESFIPFYLNPDWIESAEDFRPYRWPRYEPVHHFR